MIERATAGPDETEQVGRAIAAVVGPGDVVVLRGDLGAGKTTLVRGAARALCVTGHVTSPTFTVAQRYVGTVPVAHIDAYRLGDVDDEEIGLLLETAAEAVTFVEWPEAVMDAFGDAAVVVDLAHAGRDRRTLTLTCDEPAREARLEVELGDARD